MVLATDAPGWLAGPAIGAAIAGVGYVGKLLIDAWSGVRRRRAAEVTRLIQLEALLDASRAAYHSQHDLRERLLTSLRTRCPDTFDRDRGAEWNLQHHYERFDAEERDLHRLIRGYTEHALRSLNVDMLSWLNSDDAFRAGRATHGTDQLTGMLRQLHKHLLLWIAKYEVWIPGEPRHALVYLNDEQRHGVGFPKGIEDAVRSVIGAYGSSPSWVLAPTNASHV